jgi:hypothetical protein
MAKLMAEMTGMGGFDPSAMQQGSQNPFDILQAQQQFQQMMNPPKDPPK